MLVRSLLLVVALLATHSALRADGPLTEGFWRMNIVSPTGESTMAVLKVEMKDGKPEATVVATQRNLNMNVKEIKVQGNDLTITFALNQNAVAFHGSASRGAKAILGGYGTDLFLNRAKLVAANSGDLPAPVRTPPPETYTKLTQLMAKQNTLRIQIQQEQDAEKKKELTKQLTEARKEATEKMPALHREIVEKHPDTLSGMESALTLLRSAGSMKVTPDEAAKLIKVIEQAAQPYGPKYTRVTMEQLGFSLANLKGFGNVALPLIEPAAKALKDTDNVERQAQVLSNYHTALVGSGKLDQAKDIEARLTRIDEKLDGEYRKTVPPFQPTTFAGRKDSKANQVVMFELFTGAQCPPCVAADVAFDGLVKTYKPSELVLVQYHLHIPGPDPLSNPDNYARWEYYRETFAQQMGGVPSSVFNGKPQAGGGGPMANGERKYTQYREIIDKEIEQATPINLSGSATRDGDKVGILVNVNVTGDASDKLKLRVLVVEDEIKYVGSNRIRFHHHVVRAMPGGAAGVAVRDKSFSHKAELNLAELRTKLGDYLDDYAANTRPFPNAKRPMDMKHLKVIAFIQNDATREILQAVQFDVAGKETAAK